MLLFGGEADVAGGEGAGPDQETEVLNEASLAAFDSGAWAVLPISGGGSSREFLASCYLLSAPTVMATASANAGVLRSSCAFLSHPRIALLSLDKRRLRVCASLVMPSCCMLVNGS